MSDAAAWIMVGGLALAVAISLVALIVAASRTPGPPGPVGPMGMRGEPGVCRCPREDPDDADGGRGTPEEIRYRAVIHWADREVIGHGPPQIIVMRAERDGQECVDRHGATRYDVERWTASRGWHELED